MDPKSLARKILDMRQHTGYEVKVSAYPDCDLCKSGLDPELWVADSCEIEIARYDARTVYGPWAYLCQAHMITHGTGLGTGRGQRLVVPEP